MRASYRRIRSVGVYVLPSLLLVALWLPGINQGALRTDSDLYAAIGLHAWREGTLWPLMAGDQPYLNKPPLALWIHGWFLHVLGPSLWAARLPALLAAIITALFTVDAARRMSGRRVAIIAGLVLATTLEFFRTTHSVSLDLWLGVFFSAAIWLAACIVARRDERISVWRFALIGVPIGLSLLVKPFVGFFALGLITLWLLWTLRAQRSRVLAGCVCGLLVAIGVALPWHVSMYQIFGKGFTAQYVGDQVIARATGAKHNPSPWWSYAPMIGGSYWPWMLAILPAMWWALRGRSSTDDRPAARLGLLWVVTWLVVLSAFADKAPRYLIAVYPLAAWLSALWLMRDGPRLIRRGVSRWAPMVGAVLCINVLSIALSPISIHKPRERAWGKAAEVLDQQPIGVRLWTLPGSVTLGANIYLDRGVWPMTANETGTMHDDEYTPNAGDLLLMRSKSRFVTRAGDETLFESQTILIVRLGSAWDGVLESQP